MTDLSFGITADPSDAVAAADDVGEAFEEIGDSAEDAGDRIEQMVGRALAGLGAVAVALLEVQAQFDEINSTTTEAAFNARRAGFSPQEGQAAEAFFNDTGVELSDLAGIREGLAGDLFELNDERRRALDLLGVDIGDFRSDTAVGQIDSLLQAAQRGAQDQAGFEALSAVFGGDAQLLGAIGRDEAFDAIGFQPFVDEFVQSPGLTVESEQVRSARFASLEQGLVQQALRSQENDPALLNRALVGFEAAFEGLAGSVPLAGDELGPLAGTLARAPREQVTRLVISLDENAYNRGIRSDVNDSNRSGQIGSGSIDSGE